MPKAVQICWTSLGLLARQHASHRWLDRACSGIINFVSLDREERDPDGVKNTYMYHSLRLCLTSAVPGDNLTKAPPHLGWLMTIMFTTSASILVLLINALQFSTWKSPQCRPSNMATSCSSNRRCSGPFGSFQSCACICQRCYYGPSLI